MAWQITGTWINACSCKAICPCILGPAEPDQGWCSGADIIDIREGSSDGVNLAGCKVADVLDLPKDFVSGNGTARLYIDEACSADQRRELEAIFTGKKGGVWEGFEALITKRLPTQVTKIDFKMGDSHSATIGSVGQIKAQPLKAENGKTAKVVSAPALHGFDVESADVAKATGTSWSDPDMRKWQGDSAFVIPFKWSA